MKFDIRTIRHSEHRFLTIGDWFEKDGVLHVLCTELPDWRWTIGVFVHELVEWIWCKRHGVTSDKCDEFDEFYELEYRAGRIPIEQSAGYDPRCPYRKGHAWGDRIAWLIETFLGVNQKERESYIDSLLNVPRWNKYVTTKPSSYARSLSERHYPGV